MNQPLAYVHPEAKIHPSVEIGPFVTIDRNVEIGEGTRILSNVTIMEGARIGKNCTIYPGAVISGPPQDLKFKGEDTVAIIGDNTVIRECVTIHRGTASKGKTVVGDNCLIMAYCHVAHDCVVKNNVIMSNAVQLAGEVIVDDFAVVGGGALVVEKHHRGKTSHHDRMHDLVGMRKEFNARIRYRIRGKREPQYRSENNHRGPPAYKKVSKFHKSLNQGAKLTTFSGKTKRGIFQHGISLLSYMWSVAVSSLPNRFPELCLSDP